MLPAPARRTLRPSDRMKRRADFLRAQDGGRKIHTPHFVVCVWSRGDLDAPRLGITVTRKIGGATLRNRVKRIVREVFRCNRGLFPTGCDVVLIGKANAWTLGTAQVLEELRAVSPSISRASGARRGRR